MNFNEYYTEGIFGKFKKDEFTFDVAKDFTTFWPMSQAEFLEINEYFYHMHKTKESLVSNKDAGSGFTIVNIKSSNDFNKNKIIDKNYTLRADWDIVTAFTTYFTEGLKKGGGKIFSFTLTNSEKKENTFFIAVDKNFIKSSNLDKNSFMTLIKINSRKLMLQKEQEREEKEQVKNLRIKYKEVSKEFYIRSINYHAHETPFPFLKPEGVTKFPTVPGTLFQALSSYGIKSKNKKITGVYFSTVIGVKEDGSEDTTKVGRVVFFSWIDEQNKEQYFIGVSQKFGQSFYSLDKYIKYIQESIEDDREQKRKEDEEKREEEKKARERMLSAKSMKAIAHQDTQELAQQLQQRRIEDENKKQKEREEVEAEWKKRHPQTTPASTKPVKPSSSRDDAQAQREERELEKGQKRQEEIKKALEFYRKQNKSTKAKPKKEQKKLKPVAQKSKAEKVENALKIAKKPIALKKKITKK